MISVSERLEQITYLQALVIGIVLAGFYYYFLYSVQNVDAVITDLNQNITNLNKEIAEKDELIKEKQVVEAEILKNSSSFSKSREIIKQGFSENEALEILTNTSRELGLSIDGLGTFGSWEAENTLVKAQISVNLEGSYEQMLFLLSELTRKENFFAVKKLAMTSSSGAEYKSNLQIQIDFLVMRESKRLTEKPETSDAFNEGVEY